jgi:hypothetical protein
MTQPHIPEDCNCIHHCKPQISQTSLDDTVNDMTTRSSPHILVPVISCQQCGTTNLSHYSLSFSPHSTRVLFFFQQQKCKKFQKQKTVAAQHSNIKHRQNQGCTNFPDINQLPENSKAP